MQSYLYSSNDNTSVVLWAAAGSLVVVVVFSVINRNRYKSTDAAYRIGEYRYTAVVRKRKLHNLFVLPPTILHYNIVNRRTSAVFVCFITCSFSFFYPDERVFAIDRIRFLGFTPVGSESKSRLRRSTTRRHAETNEIRLVRYGFAATRDLVIVLGPLLWATLREIERLRRLNRARDPSPWKHDGPPPRQWIVFRVSAQQSAGRRRRSTLVFLLELLASNGRVIMRTRACVPNSERVVSTNEDDCAGVTRRGDFVAGRKRVLENSTTLRKRPQAVFFPRNTKPANAPTRGWNPCVETNTEIRYSPPDPVCSRIESV